jgi:hypothetical protein
VAVTRPETTAPPPSNANVVELKAIQIATRWLVGAGASVLAVLLAGVQLSALGQLAADRPGRLVIAIIACAVGLLAVGTILVLAARVLVSPGWTLSKLAHLETQHHWQHHWLQRELEAQRGLLTPGDELQPSRLYRRHRRLYVAWFELLEKGATTLPDDLDNEHHNPTNHNPNHNPGRDYLVTNNDDVERLRRRLEEAASISEGIATAANLVATRRRYRRLVHTLPVLGILPVIAVPLFIWATTVQPEPAITTPTAIHIKFTPDRAALQHAGLGPNCADRDINAIAVGGTLPRPIVVSTSDPRCTLNQIRITPALGTAIPALPPH